MLGLLPLRRQAWQLVTASSRRALLHAGACLTAGRRSMPPALLVINYYTRSPHPRLSAEPSAQDDATTSETARLADSCVKHAFSSTTRQPSYLPSLLQQHKKLRQLVQRLLTVSQPLHVAFMFDLKRPGPDESSAIRASSSPQMGNPDAAALSASAAPQVAAAATASAAGTLSAEASGAGGAVSSSHALPSCTDREVLLPRSCSHVILSGGNYVANDIDVARVFDRLPPGAKVFGICW